jgi:hypothetical protein
MANNTNSPDHRLFRQMLEIEFDDLGKYIQESLAALRKGEAEKEQRVQDLEFMIQANEDKLQLGKEKNHFLGSSPFMLKHSFFIAVYSFMEYSLKKICEIAASHLNQHERRVSNFEKVHQFYSFLIDEVKLDKNKVEVDWIKLNIFRDLRNSIIHYNSSIGKNISAKTYNFIKEDVRIEFEEPRVFKIKDDGLILELMETSKNFLLTLIDEYDQKYFKN